MGFGRGAGSAPAVPGRGLADESSRSVFRSAEEGKSTFPLFVSKGIDFTAGRCFVFSSQVKRTATLDHLWPGFLNRGST